MTHSLLSTVSLFLSFVFSIVIALILLRCFMQLFRVSFVSPIGQACLKFTQPFLKPFQKVFPFVGRLDLSCTFVAFLLHALFIVIAGFLNQYNISLAQIPLWAAVGVITISIRLYIVLFIIYVISSFLPDLRAQPFYRTVDQLCDPLIRPFRERLPSLGGLDFSPIILFLGANLILHFFSTIPVIVAGSRFILGL